ncbi:hypothetical protein A1D22_02910 [Pasteurellaceae bacterium LFhippo2]|nr:hypothetical protein [Pasteurellaceae bacterium LFhippo2]
MKKSFLLFTLFPILALANPDSTEQKLQNVAKPQAQQQAMPTLGSAQEILEITDEQLKQNPRLTQELLNRAIYGRKPEYIDQLLPIYQSFENHDKTLVQYALGKSALLKGNYSEAVGLFRQIIAENPELNTVRIELAIALFYDQQNGAAEDQFNKAKSAEDLPQPVAQVIDAYQDALQKRSSWNFSGYFQYERDKNINSTSKSREIENTGYIKNSNMLPQSAHGLAYGFNLSRDFNLTGSHYLAFENSFSAKSYWDNHGYDDITNRTLLGYAYKKSDKTARLLPFYEKRWYGGSSYRWSNGVRLEYNQWLNPRWQISTAFEYGKQRYFDSTAQNGTTKLASATLLWLRNPKQFFYLGSDFNAERVQVKQYSSDTKSVRVGWGQEWETLGLSSRLGFSVTKRDYKDTARLGGLLNLGKVRSDKVYGANLILWKRDWHLFGITPKLKLSYRKHDSNLPTLYSYTDKQVNMVFESQF